ncbi:hypothetical protein V8F33_010074 [Rhypophila sp. PSN 637]
MDPTLEQRNVFSNNTLSVSGDDVCVQYGNNYNWSGPTKPSWGNVSRWIFGSEPVFSQRTFQASLQRRREEKHTGLWFLDGEAFRHWQAQPGSFLWLHGKTGCGKTMLCSSAIDRLHSVNSRSSNQALIYHFFTVTHQRSRTSDTLVRTLVYQLAGYNDETRARAKELYNQAGEDNEPADCDQLLSVYVVIDSLDECADQDETCALLEELCGNVPGIRILASSNTTQTRETEATLNKLDTSKIYVTTRAVNGDREAHIRKMDLPEWEETQKDSIVRHITAGSDGSFRWAVGQLLEIKKCDTELELDKALKSLPESLTETYERILSGITMDSDIQNLKILLCWLLYAARPLRIEELRQTVAIDWLDKPYFDEKKRLNQRPRIFDQCTFLIAIDEDSEERSTWHKGAVLRLAHSSVFQFLQETKKLSAHARRFSTAQPAGDLMLAQSSLVYILSLDSTETQTLATVPLFNYAIHNWYSHAQKAGPGNTEVLGALIREVLDTGWDIYRLVTYPNPSTRYNPWARPQMTTPDYAGHAGQGNYRCETCQKLQYCERWRPSGFRRGTYDRLVISAHTCKLCGMIRHSFIQFALARYCQIHAERTLSEEDSETLGLEFDDKIRRNAGGAEVWLKAENKDPFLLISCYCYFGRLHLFTNPAPLGPKTNAARESTKNLVWRTESWEDRFIRTPEISGFLKLAHIGFARQSSPRLLPKMVIEVGDGSVRLLDTQDMPQDRYATLSHWWGDTPWPPTTTRANLQSLMHDMRLDLLPSTYRAAIIITRHLGIRYLWIDSLCIVQEDFLIEEPKRSDYFSNAILNIVTGVPGSSTSIFLPRVPPRFSPICVNESEDIFLGWIVSKGSPMGKRQDQASNNRGLYGLSWASRNGKVKHVWPLNATVCAEALESCINARGADTLGQVDGGFIVIRGPLVQFQGANGPGAFAAWAGEVTVNIRAEKGYVAGVRIYYHLDHFGSVDDLDGSGGVDFTIDDFYGLKITRRVALLLKKDERNYVVNRVGLVIVAKPDTPKWGLVSEQCDVKIV